MQNTMNLLERALKQHPAPYWHQKLNLSRNALHTAKHRGNLSPAVAGALADVMGEDVQRWMLVAALESERDSACKNRMLDRLRPLITSFYGGKRPAHRPRFSCRWIWSRRQDKETPSMSASIGWVYQPERQALTA